MFNIKFASDWIQTVAWSNNSAKWATTTLIVKTFVTESPLLQTNCATHLPLYLNRLSLMEKPFPAFILVKATGKNNEARKSVARSLCGSWFRTWTTAFGITWSRSLLRDRFGVVEGFNNVSISSHTYLSNSVCSNCSVASAPLFRFYVIGLA